MIGKFAVAVPPFPLTENESYTVRLCTA